MKLRAGSTVARAAAVATAMAIGGAALPAASSAAVPTICAFPKKDITISISSNMPESYRNYFDLAVTNWSVYSQKINITNLGVNRNADIFVLYDRIEKYAAGPYLGLTRRTCGSSSATIIVDSDNSPNFPKTIWSVAKVASHELGHVLGLNDNAATSGTCGGFIPKPVGVMGPTNFDGAVLCGVAFPTQEELNAVDGLYK